jgi:homoserine/homoserine lactone efflux protein
MNYEIVSLSVFIPTFFFVSATPGMCMLLALTLGIKLGVRRTMWMMIGEVIGVGIIATLSVVGVSAMMAEYPDWFQGFKLIGGSYLFYIGVQMWRSKGKMAIDLENEVTETSRFSLSLQGFITTLLNPKGWAFFVSLLPPFMDYAEPLFPQLSIYIPIIIFLEFTCMMIYATGGKTLGALLTKSGNVVLLNRIPGSLMLILSVWFITN